MIYIFYKYYPKSIISFIKNIKNSELSFRLIKGFGWTTLAVIVSRGAALLASIPMARFLGKQRFGEFGIIFNTITMFCILGNGIGLTTAKYVAEYKNKDKEKTQRIITLSLIISLTFGIFIALLLLLTSSYLAEKIFSAPKLKPLIILCGLCILINLSNQVQNGILVGMEVFKRIAVRNFWGGILRIIYMVLFSWFFGVKGAVIGILLTEASMWLFNHYEVKNQILKNSIKIKFNCDFFKEIKIFKIFFIPAILTGAILGPTTWICNILIIKKQNGYEQIGLYNMAIQWKTLINFFPLALNEVLLPILSELSTSNKEKKFMIVFRSAILFYTFITSIFAISIIIFSSIIVNFYGEGFFDGLNILRVTAFSSILFSIQEFLIRSLASQGKMWLGFIYRAISCIVMISFTFWFSHNGCGAIGLAISTIIAYTTVIIIYFFGVYDFHVHLHY